MSRLLSLQFLVLALALSIQTEGALVCPADFPSTFPCTCASSGTPLREFVITCTKPAQSDLDSVLARVRLANNVPPKALLTPVNRFIIQELAIAEINLDGLDNAEFNTVLIQNNPLLTSILPPSRVNFTSFSAEIVRVINSQLTDAGAGNVLGYLVPSSLVSLDFAGNQLTGSHGTNVQDFLPNLSKFENLNFLTVKSNKVQALGGGQFANCSGLTTVDLSNNTITSLTRDAFLLTEPRIGKTLTILLDNNGLMDGAIHPGHGLQENKDIPKFVSMKDNKFDFISEENFRSSISPQGPVMNLTLAGNPFICNEKLQWLRNEREELQQYVSGVDCTNDPGKTVFDTDLLPNGAMPGTQLSFLLVILMAIANYAVHL